MRLFVFGGGFTGLTLARRVVRAGGSATATSRDPARREALRAAGAAAIDPADPSAVDRAVATAEAVLICAPPTPGGCPGLAAVERAYTAAGPAPRWIGYLSTTGVYGDRGGGWVSESSGLRARSTEAVRRVRSEHDWLAFGDREPRSCIAVFRLPGIYGPGRSTLDRVRAGRTTRAIKPGQIFSRIHVEDLADALEASIARPRRGAVYNVCDDLPAPPTAVTAWACALLGLPCPPETPFQEAAMSSAAQRFWGESKRVSNALAKAELDWRPRHATFREGLASLLPS